MQVINIEAIRLTAPLRDSGGRCDICGGVDTCPGGEVVFAVIGQPFQLIPPETNPPEGWVVTHQTKRHWVIIPSFAQIYGVMQSKRIYAHRPDHAEDLCFDWVQQCGYVAWVGPRQNPSFAMVYLPAGERDEHGKCKTCGGVELCPGGKWILVAREDPVHTLHITQPKPSGMQLINKAGRYCDYVPDFLPLFKDDEAEKILKHVPNGIRVALWSAPPPDYTGWVLHRVFYTLDKIFFVLRKY